MVPRRYYIAVAVAVLLLFWSRTAASQQIDTLRRYDPQSPLVYYGNPSVRAIGARFETSGFEKVTRIMVALGGADSTASALLHVYGQEGGANAPFLAVDLVQPIRITKTRPGVEQVDIVLDPPLSLQGHQFYIVLDNISSGLRVMSDSRPREAVCVSDREQFMSQLVRYSDGRWRSGRYAFRIDVVTERPSSRVSPMFANVTAEACAPDSVIADGFIAWGDYDNDNWLDLLVGAQLFHNTRDGRFQDVTGVAGLTTSPSVRVFVDANSDGRVDILSFGASTEDASENMMFLQTEGGQFVGHNLQLPALENISSVSLSDFDLDGFTDAYVGCYSHDSTDARGGYLLRNTGSNGFVDVSGRLGMPVRTLGSQWVDADRKGEGLSLFVASPDSGASIWKNRGDGTFKPVETVLNGAAGRTTPTHGAYGCHWVDVDSDGDLDLLQPQMIPIGQLATRNSDVLMINNGDRRYAARDGDAIVYNEMHAGGTWGDLDNDGRIDLVLTTACDCRSMDIYRQYDDGRFVQETENLGMLGFAVGPDATLADYDNDGHLDIATRHNGRFVLLRNLGRSTNNFIAFDLGAGNTAGTEITVHAGNKRSVGYAASGRGYLVQDPPRLQFGLGDAGHVDSIEVRRPDGSRFLLSDFTANTVHRLENRAVASNTSTESAAVRAYPNPFRDMINFEVDIASAQHISLKLYTTSGALVATLIDDDRTPGKHSMIWTPGGNDVVQGTYVYRLTGERFPEQQGRIVLIR